MSRILTAILSLHWAVVFALAAAERVDGYGGFAAPLSGSFIPLGIATGYGLVAILFLWTAVSALAGGRRSPGETVQVARLAFCGAVLALMVGLVGAGVSLSTAGATPFAVQLAALLCTYLVMRLDGREAEDGAQKEGFHTTRAAARLMALGAAHRTLLAPPGGRFVAANDEKDR